MNPVLCSAPPGSFRLWGLALACLGLLSGCSRFGDLAGRVTYQGRPLRVGSVAVVGDDGIVRGGQIQDDGSYAIEKIPLGTVRITVHSPDPLSLPPPSQKIPVPASTPPTQRDRSRWFPIPNKYSDFGQSDLKSQIAKGANRLDIDLK